MPPSPAAASSELCLLTVSRIKETKENLQNREKEEEEKMEKKRKYSYCNIILVSLLQGKIEAYLWASNHKLTVQTN